MGGIKGRFGVGQVAEAEIAEHETKTHVERVRVGSAPSAIYGACDGVDILQEAGHAHAARH